MVKKRIVLAGIGSEDPELRDLVLGVAEAIGVRGFQARVGLDGYEIVVEGDEGVVEDVIAMLRELRGGDVAVEDFEGRVMDLDMYKRVLHVRENPDEVRERRSQA